jgi:ketopantoate reductase
VRIAILGTGAMGSVYAGLLASAGLDVWAVDTWAEHVEAMRRDGLRVSGASGERTARLSATTLDVINGAVPRVGAEVGVAAPVNEVIAAIVRAKETLFPAQGR